MSNAFVTIKMCYVYNQWYDISCATLYISGLLKRDHCHYHSDYVLSYLTTKLLDAFCEVLLHWTLV